jgi:multidrug efflux pump subunit AcrA (membrane-fusion protein)
MAAERLAACPDRPPVRRYLVAALAVLTLFLGMAVFWGMVAPLASAAIALGSVNLDTSRKTVQHLEGGIVSEIRVREGQTVEQGDVLISLDETQARARIDLLEAQINSETRQLGYLSEEIAGVEQLEREGLAPKTKLLALYRGRAEIEGRRTEHGAQLDAARDVIERSDIRAPITGTVVGLQVHTAGGIIKPGEVLLSIVPRDEPLVVEAHLDPNDIDVVHKGLEAQVRLTPLNARTVPPLAGRVVWVSADRLSDERTGSSYYLARIEIEPDSGSLPDDVVLYPGMPAEVMIPTGERTFADYLIAPITRSFRRALREQ